MSLKNIKIKNKLIAGFGVMAVLVLVIAGMSLRALGTATDNFARYVNGINARADVADQVRAAVDRRAIAARNLVLVTTPADVEMEKAEVLRAHEDVQARLKQLKDMIATASDTSDKARSLVAEIDRVEALYGPVATNIVGLALAGKRDEAITKMDDECRPLLAALVKATDTYASFTRDRREAIVQRVSERVRDAAQRCCSRCPPSRCCSPSSARRVDHALGHPCRSALPSISRARWRAATCAAGSSPTRRTKRASCCAPCAT